MGKDAAIEQVKVENELSSCQRCGAGTGFHVSFLRRERVLEVILVCPSCGFRFTAGDWTFPTREPRPFDPSIDAGP